MFNDELILIKNARPGRDKYLNSVKKEQSRKTILCNVDSVTRQVYYGSYDDESMRPEFIVTINKCEYDNERDCELRGREYKISRTYEVDRDLLELTLERRR